MLSALASRPRLCIIALLVDGPQYVRLPYGTGLDDTLADLDAEAWDAMVEDLAPERLGTLALPRFELEWEAELNDALDALGMGVAFGSGADFSPMSPTNPFLDVVVQKTYLRVDEEGTEAAAVSGGVMEESAPPDLRIDRPFAFTVSDRETGAILFLGTVHDPRG